MAILEAQFVKSIWGTDPILDDGKQQIAFIGRSNVGKSSLINSLVGMKSLARSSSSPGKTISLDFFRVGTDTYFVDLPGYGYATVDAKQREKFRKMIAWYLLRSGVKQKLVVLILDANVGITDYDRESMKLLHEAGLPFVIVANKIDKPKMGEREKLLAKIAAEAKDESVIPYSAKTGEGRKDLLKRIFDSR